MTVKADLEACIEMLRAVLERIEAGEFDASVGQITYLRGALETLEWMIHPPIRG